MNTLENENLGFMYIAEETSPIDFGVKNVHVYNQNGVFYVEFDTCLHSFNVINRNNRQYMSDNVMENITGSERIQSMLADNAWYGEMDHPTQETQNAKLTPERIQAIWMPNRSHKIMNPSLSGDLLLARIQTASGTEAGRGFAAEIIQGLIPSFSCRAIASLKLINGKPTVIVKKIITYDWVLFPSHKEAKITGTAKGVTKSIKTFTESVGDAVSTGVKRFKEFSTECMIPLTEILENVGRKDINTQIIMESFDLSNEDLLGFNETGDHIKIKCDNNIIYSKISPDSVKEVNDFYNSFKL